MPDTVMMAYKYRLYPNAEQREWMARCFGCCRFVYNHFLRERQASWERTQKELRRPKAVLGTEGDEKPEWVRDEDGKVVYEMVPNEAYDPEAKPMSYFDTSKALTKLKKEVVGDDGERFLAEADAVALCYELRNLDHAYQNFFRGLKLPAARRPGFPRPKRKGDRDSYKTAGKNIVVDAEGGRVKLPKLGWVRCRVHRPPTGRIVSATVSRVSSGKYFVSLQCEGVDAPAQTASDEAVGIEVGVQHAAVSSDGQVWDGRDVSALERRLAHAKRDLSRKQGARKGERQSNRYRKQKLKVARLEERIANIRVAEAHRISHEIAESYGTVCIRKTDWAGLRKKADPDERETPRFVERRQNKALADAGLGELQRQIAYKVQWRGGDAVIVDGNPATTQTCSVCGHKEASLAGERGLSVREWVCPECGTHHQRDVNSARNLLAAGLAQQDEAARELVQPAPKKKAKRKTA